MESSVCRMGTSPSILMVESTNLNREISMGSKIARCSPEIEKKVKESAEKGNITFATGESLDAYGCVVDDFLEKALGLDAEECFVSDLSSLSDFVGCGLPDLNPDDYQDYESFADAWLDGMKKKVSSVYGVDVEMRDTLPMICSKIENRRMVQ